MRSAGADIYSVDDQDGREMRDGTRKVALEEQDQAQENLQAGTSSEGGTAQ
jgi:hypothetical protein